VETKEYRAQITKAEEAAADIQEVTWGTEHEHRTNPNPNPN